MSHRHKYRLTLPCSEPARAPAPMADLRIAPASTDDRQSLAVLMIEAYRGTIDYDGETVADALNEIDAYLAGERGGPPDLSASWLAYIGGELASACLIAQWSERKCPLVAYVMTSGRWKGKGLGHRVLGESIRTLPSQAHREVRAVVTPGNQASEKLLLANGFRRVTEGSR